MNLISPNSNLLWVVVAMLATLTTGTVVRLARMRGAAADLAKSRLDSLRSWWIVATVVIAVALLGVAAACVAFTVISLLAWVEFQRLAKADMPVRVRWLAMALVPASYLLIGLGFMSSFQVFLPLAAVAMISLALVCQERINGFLNAAATTVWGLLVTTYLLGHVVLLFSLPDSTTGITAGASWFLLLVLLTEGSDIMQALVGRRFGRRKLAPIVSPGKTWAGLFGGVTATVLLALLIGPWLTPLTHWQAAFAGLLVSLVGAFGDLNISALKRDAGVKDSGTILPGQGGILDRIDSLSFTAPAFFYVARAMIGHAP